MVISRYLPLAPVFFTWYRTVSAHEFQSLCNVIWAIETYTIKPLLHKIVDDKKCAFKIETASELQWQI